MKNVFKLFGIIVLLAVIGFSMATCGGNDDSSVNLKGTNWKGETTQKGTTLVITLTFTASEFQMVITAPSMPGVSETHRGTYTFDGKSAGTMTEYGDTMLLQVNGKKLTVVGIYNGSITFTKQ